MSLNNFEYTALDVQKVLEKNQKPITIKNIKIVFEKVDQNIIIQKASKGRNFPEQMSLLISTLESEMMRTKVI